MMFVDGLKMFVDGLSTNVVVDQMMFVDGLKMFVDDQMMFVDDQMMFVDGLSTNVVVDLNLIYFEMNLKMCFVDCLKNCALANRNCHKWIHLKSFEQIFLGMLLIWIAS
jgi:hypothetical protein